MLWFWGLILIKNVTFSWKGAEILAFASFYGIKNVLYVPENVANVRFNDVEVIFWQTLWVLECFGHVLMISELTKAFWRLLRRIVSKILQKGVFSFKKIAIFGFLSGDCPKYASVGSKNAFQGLQIVETCLKQLQTKRFVLKHRQNDPTTLFVKIKFLQNFQNFEFWNVAFFHTISAWHENDENWKCVNLVMLKSI